MLLAMFTICLSHQIYISKYIFRFLNHKAHHRRNMNICAFFVKLLSAVLILFAIYFGKSIEENLDEVKIGVLVKHKRHERIINKSIQNINNDKTILPFTKLSAIFEYVADAENSFRASTAICRLLKQQVLTIIGPQSVQLTAVIQSITSAYKIPLVLISWQPLSKYYSDSNSKEVSSVATTASRVRRKRPIYDDVTSSSSSSQQRLNNDFTINLYPHTDQLSDAYLDLIRYKNWKNFAIIYDSAEDFIRLKSVLQTSFAGANINVYKVNDLETNLVTVNNDNVDDKNEVKKFQLRLEGKENNNDGDESDEKVCQFGSPSSSSSQQLGYSKLMKHLRMKGVENIMLSMTLDKVCKIFKEAAREQLLTIYNDYIVATLDAHRLNFTGNSHAVLANISGFSILDPAGQQQLDDGGQFAAVTAGAGSRWLGKRPLARPKRLLSSEFAIMSDAMTLIAQAIDELLATGTRYSPIQLPPSIDCGGNSKVHQQQWEHGQALMGLLKDSPRYGGYTGDIKFDSHGRRVDFELEFIMHKNSSFKKIGSWNANDKLWGLAKPADDFNFAAIKNKTLIVTVSMTQPYVMHADNYLERAGNDRYQGYCIDLLAKLARKLQFKYVIKQVDDGQYGKIGKNGTWNGMIRELLDWKADLAIVDLTITKERQSAVDFTHPFMTLGIAIMFRKPKLENNTRELFSFMMPLSTEVWLSMVSALVGVSLVMWLISRLSPLEWKNPHPCIDDVQEHDYENELHSIGASMWFIIGSLMQQGSDLAPRSPSVRLLASVWFFFTLILISSYTANFAAFLTASRMQSPIENADDLSKQTKIDYGCKEGGSTQAFFASSNHSIYRRMWNFMESRKHQGVFPADNAKGIAMVKKGNFAFLMESTSIDYVAQRDCEITQIGGLLDHKGYGIALRKRSPFRAALSKAIVELNEAGELQDLKNRWWTNLEVGGASCVERKESALAASELGIDKVGGVFVVLGVGVCLALSVVILEFVWRSLKMAKDERKPIRLMLWREIVRISKCGPSKRENAGESAIYGRASSHRSPTNLRGSSTSFNNNTNANNTAASGRRNQFKSFSKNQTSSFESQASQQPLYNLHVNRQQFKGGGQKQKQLETEPTVFM